MTRQTSPQLMSALGRFFPGSLYSAPYVAVDSQAQALHWATAKAPAPLRGKELVDDDLGVERSVEERDEDDDDQRDDRDRGEDETELGSSGETLGTEECDE